VYNCEHQQDLTGLRISGLPFREASLKSETRSKHNRLRERVVLPPEEEAEKGAESRHDKVSFLWVPQSR